MARTTSTQRGASSRTTAAKKRSGGARASATSRTGASKRSGSAPRKPAVRSRAAAPKRSALALRPAGPWVPVIVVGLVVVLGWSLYPALKLQYQTSRRAAGLQQQYQTLRQRNEKLSAEVAALKTPEGVAKAARETLGYAKKGDNVYVVIPSGSGTSTSAAAASVAGEPSSLIQTVLDAIFGVTAPTSPSLEP